MPFKPNYRMQRSERTKAKQARAEEKLKSRQARASQRGEGEAEAEEPAAEPKESEPE